MSASWTGSASRSVVILPNGVDVRMCTAISQAKVSQSALMFGSLWPFLRLETLNVGCDFVLCSELYEYPGPLDRV